MSGVARRHGFPASATLSSADKSFRRNLELCRFAHCARVSFDSSRGDLFVCRVACNFVNAENLASFEFAVEALEFPLLLVLLH